MKSEWKIQSLSNFVEFNPSERLPKGTLARKYAMDKLQPFVRDALEYTIEPYCGGTKFRNGDTIMARITPCLENGKTAYVNQLSQGEVAFGSTEFIVMRAKEGISDPRFVYYLASSSIIREPAIKSMVGSSGRQRVQTDVVMALEIPLPSFSEQKAIAEVLSTIDDRIALNRKINDHLAA